MTRIAVRTVPWIVAAFYAYGALVHVMNMASLTGFDWPAAPLKWQVLDVVYLILDVIVVAGLIRGWRLGYWAFFTAALSQILLYTLLRDWITDVPDAFARAPEEIAYLDTLVIFHLVTLAAMGGVLWLKRRGPG